MKRTHYILGITLIILIVIYFVDKEVAMKKRVLRHNLWEHQSGASARGDFIDIQEAVFKGDTMIFDYGVHGKDTLIFKSQYFSKLKVINPKTKEIGKYTMKGGNWIDYLFKK